MKKKNKIKLSLMSDILMIVYISSVAGFGTFWLCILLRLGVMSSIFFGCMMSSCAMSLFLTPIIEKKYEEKE